MYPPAHCTFAHAMAPDPATQGFRQGWYPTSFRLPLSRDPPRRRLARTKPETHSSPDTKLSKNQPPLGDEGFERAQRLASGRVDAADVAWLSKGFSAFLAAGGALPLERCLGLPRNDCALRRACRDYWLRRAWQALDDEPFAVATVGEARSGGAQISNGTVGAMAHAGGRTDPSKRGGACSVRGIPLIGARPPERNATA